MIFELNVCTHLGEATWTRPGADMDEHRSLNDINNETGGVSPSDSGGDDWVCNVDEESGQEYWYNSRTGESSWAQYIYTCILFKDMYD